jgi:hypothetical protein
MAMIQGTKWRKMMENNKFCTGEDLEGDGSGLFKSAITSFDGRKERLIKYVGL